jgi:hypothetical protein
VLLAANVALLVLLVVLGLFSLALALDARMRRREEGGER